MIHLDTHIVVWLFSREPEKFSTRALTLLDEHNLQISPIVRLELRYLHEIGRLQTRADEILEYLKRRIQLSVSEIPFNQVIDYSLDLEWTRDPFDRIIVAQSRSENVPLLTKDSRILQNYAGAVWE